MGNDSIWYSTPCPGNGIGAMLPARSVVPMLQMRFRPFDHTFGLTIEDPFVGLAGLQPKVQTR